VCVGGGGEGEGWGGGCWGTQHWHCNVGAVCVCASSMYELIRVHCICCAVVAVMLGCGSFQLHCPVPLTFVGSAFSMRPYSSQCSLSSAHEYPSLQAAAAAAT
jgi:hypothetical protein